MTPNLIRRRPEYHTRQVKKAKVCLRKGGGGPQIAFIHTLGKVKELPTSVGHTFPSSYFMKAILVLSLKICTRLSQG